MLAYLAAGIAAAGIVAGAVAAARSGSIRVGIPIMLDLWMAGGLLKLSADSAWSSIAIAAVTIALRKLVSRGVTSRPSG